MKNWFLDHLIGVALGTLVLFFGYKLVEFMFAYSSLLFYSFAIAFAVEISYEISSLFVKKFNKQLKSK